MNCGGWYRDHLSRIPRTRYMKLIIRQNIASQRVWFGRFYSLSGNLSIMSTKDDVLGDSVLFLRFKVDLTEGHQPP